jgi:uncharacterized protein YbjT (DUF2867 family)
MTTRRIAVAGGTGWAGKSVVRALRSRDAEVVVLARSCGVDLVTGDGLGARMEGVDAVIDVTNITTQREEKATRFFESVTATLLNAGQTAGVQHHLVLSIVGCDRVDLGYYRAKRRQEERVLTGPVPSTVLRATQFHEFAAQMLGARGPLVLAPKMACQPIALDEVAEHLASLVFGEPQGRAPDIAGPQPQMMDEMVVRLAKEQGDRRPRLRVGMPGRIGRQIKAGGLLPTGPGPRGVVTFDEWLARAGP